MATPVSCERWMDARVRWHRRVASYSGVGVPRSLRTSGRQPGETQSKAMREALPRLMAGVAQLKVPLVAEVGVGANWDQAH